MLIIHLSCGQFVTELIYRLAATALPDIVVAQDITTNSAMESISAGSGLCGSVVHGMVVVQTGQLQLGQ